MLLLCLVSDHMKDRKKQKTITIATVNGRAYYYFVTLLRSLGYQHEDLLPWEVSDDSNLLLTTEREKPHGFKGELLLFEELNGDEVHDKFEIARKIKAGAADVLTIGIDPGGITGVVAIYKGVIIAFRSFDHVGQAVRLVNHTLSLPAKKKVVRIGSGNWRGKDIANLLLQTADKDTTIEMVDEGGTSAMAKSGLPKDVVAAMSIAKRKGLQLIKA